jgi:hypothetical protein
VRLTAQDQRRSASRCLYRSGKQRLVRVKSFDDVPRRLTGSTGTASPILGVRYRQTRYLLLACVQCGVVYRGHTESKYTCKKHKVSAHHRPCKKHDACLIACISPIPKNRPNILLACFSRGLTPSIPPQKARRSLACVLQNAASRTTYSSHRLAMLLLACFSWGPIVPFAKRRYITPVTGKNALYK